MSTKYENEERIGTGDAEAKSRVANVAEDTSKVSIGCLRSPADFTLVISWR
jgi:hypothetical protein